jgi:hypothetical protein
MLDSYVMVYKWVRCSCMQRQACGPCCAQMRHRYLGDLMFYVVGSQDENELILYTILQAFYESVSILLRCVGCMRDTSSSVPSA